jgi:hypothetical protein
MRLVKIKLADSTFWFLGDLVRLTLNDPMSDFINVDSLPFEDRTIINNSAGRGEIRIFDPEKRRLKSIDEADYISGEFAVNVDDIEDDETDVIPEVFSITVDNDDGEEEANPTEVDFDNARFLLAKNGNTVRKTIREVSLATQGVLLLRACLQVELDNKNREGIVSLIKNRLNEVSNEY